jgi:uncharacterized protein
VIYLDSSALVKLAHPERHSEELVGWLATRSTRFAVTSKLAHAESMRALRRSDPLSLPQLPAVLTRLFSVPVDDRVLELAGALDDPLLRTLDAIHLATARLLGAPKLTLVTYDQRLLAIADRHGHVAVAPGT